jgi:Cu2+-exporting ATPase
VAVEPRAGQRLRQVDLIVPGVHCGACIALLEKELPKASGVDHARVNLSTRRVSVVFEDPKEWPQWRQ